MSKPMFVLGISPSSQTDYKLTLYKGTDDLASLFDAWREIVAGIDDASFIQSPDWLGSFLKSDPSASENFVAILITNKNAPVGVFPLEYLKQKRFGLNLGVWRVFWSNNDMGLSDFVFAQKPQNQVLLDLVTDFLRATSPRSFDLMLLQNVAEDSAIAYSMHFRSPAWCVSVYHHDSKYIRCKNSYDESTSGLTAKYRRNNRRKLKNLQQLGTVKFTSARNLADLKSAFDDFVNIEASSWKGHAGTALRYDDERRRFYEELLARFGVTGQCAIDVLTLNGRPIAAQFAIISGTTYNLLKIGYDSTFSAQSPGVLLLDWALREYSGHPTIRRISFVTGARWNDDWDPSKQAVFDHYLYKPTVKGGVAFLIERLKQRVKPLYLRYLESTKNRS
ncbi:GNAT family N-acetyltransferase [Thiocystis minor]|uniref:GNAT family N-acetyltransferase n=1 Tax=Thiocystis minor TaxID=61597 RepID=UPI00191256A4|nr:GNAT family N-acetyltransferase [Thiocystis minor]